MYARLLVPVVEPGKEPYLPDAAPAAVAIANPRPGFQLLRALVHGGGSLNAIPLPLIVEHCTNRKKPTGGNRLSGAILH